MSLLLRFQELRAAGPEITSEDVERLRLFVPRLKPIARAVRMAMREVSMR